VERNLVMAQEPDAANRLVEGAPPRAGQPIAIVQAPGPVYADTDIDVLLGEKSAPRFVDQRSIRLE
jgi:hypothetical protein